MPDTEGGRLMTCREIDGNMTWFGLACGPHPNKIEVYTGRISQI